LDKGFSLGQNLFWTAVVYDVLGRLVHRVRELNQSAGQHKMTWSGAGKQVYGLPSGLYIYQLHAESGGKVLFNQRRKAILLR